MFGRNRRKDREERLDEIDRFVTDSQEKVRAQEPHVTELVSWLERRKERNGFGRDFEFTMPAQPSARS